MMIRWILALVCLVSFVSADVIKLSAGAGLIVGVDDVRGGYNITLDGKLWFASGPTAVHSAGKWYRSDEKTLRVVGATAGSGQDTIGAYKSITLLWHTNSSLPFETTIQAYTETEAVLFVQTFPKGLTDGAISNATNDVIASFPTLPNSSPADLLYYTHQGEFANAHVGRWKNGPDYPGGVMSGPVTFYNSEVRTLRFSPFNDLMASQITLSAALGGNNLAFGLNGKILNIPPKYSHATLMIAGQGITDSIMAWGEVLLKSYGKKRATLDSDILIKTLGYWTDNGGAYWYNTQPNENYEETMLNAAAYIKSIDVPVTHFQLDSWWYPKGKNVGVTLWESMPSVFPDGIANVTKRLGLPVALHNRYFATDSPYVKNFSMIVEDYCALPTNEAVFDHIMTEAKEWGMVLYEQDWLITTYLMMEATQNSLVNSRNWLIDMGKAASKLDLTIQYCMPLPNHLLQSVEVPAVTQARATTDYQPSNDQWKIFHTSQLIWALGMVPFKDDFWTTSSQPGCTSSYPYGCTEVNPVLQPLVAALSAGPVGPSDFVGKMNRDLVMKTCRASGDLLKADLPAFPLESTFLPKNDNPQVALLQVASSYTNLGDFRWYFLLGADLTQTYAVDVADLPKIGSASARYINFFSTNESIPAIFDSENPIKIPAKPTIASKTSPPPPLVDFNYYIVAPVLESGWVLLGETEKFITVSKQRITSFSSTASGLELTIVGSVNEDVSISLFQTAGTKAGVLQFSTTLTTTTATLKCDKSTCSF